MPRIKTYTGDKSKDGDKYTEDGKEYIWIYDASADTHRAPCQGKLSMLGKKVGHAERCPETKQECGDNKDCLNAYKVGQMRKKKLAKLNAKFERRMVPKIKKHMKETKYHLRNSYGKCTMKCQQQVRKLPKKEQQKLLKDNDVPTNQQYCANKCYDHNDKKSYQLKL